MSMSSILINWKTLVLGNFNYFIVFIFFLEIAENFMLLLLFQCFTSTVNYYGHVRMVLTTLPLDRLRPPKGLTTSQCPYFCQHS